MVMTRKLKHDIPRLHMGRVDTVLSNKIKLLGVVIDRKLTFNTYVASICSSQCLHPEVIHHHRVDLEFK
ncbi:unnamed protein product [Euphydryas editha]|uniref:Uncharacterized protein n=1 Tax=Euphydryas editha TaxID=104508 RepID=A0AAU9TC70_EUPED|nr:unnamed protein product [Euphydryas editha]